MVLARLGQKRAALLTCMLAAAIALVLTFAVAPVRAMASEADGSAAQTPSCCSLSAEKAKAGGWKISKGKLYYVNSNGTYKKNAMYDGIVLKPSGAARDNNACKVKIKAMRVVSSITSHRMSKSQKLRACWRYVTSSRFYFYLTYPNVEKAQWWMGSANRFFTTGGGDCYSFSCALAALAHEVGYEPKIVYGRVSGSRDHAPDGLTRHCWVKINGRYYDPEATFAGWAPGIYGSWGYPVTHQTLRLYSYTNMTGVSLSSTKMGSAIKRGLTVVGKKTFFYDYYERKVRNTWKTVNGKRYYFTKTGAAATGPARVRGSHYIFNSKGVLQRGTKGKLVKLEGSIYRAKKSGKAYPGWSTGRMKHYDVTGKRDSGFTRINGSAYYFAKKTGRKVVDDIAVKKGVPYYFGNNGAMNKDESEELQSLAVIGSDASGFLVAAGVENAKAILGEGSCYRVGEGVDATYKFSNFKVSTFLPYDESQPEILLSISEA